MRSWRSTKCPGAGRYGAYLHAWGGVSRGWDMDTAVCLYLGQKFRAVLHVESSLMWASVSVSSWAPAVRAAARGLDAWPSPEPGDNETGAEDPDVAGWLKIHASRHRMSVVGGRRLGGWQFDGRRVMSATRIAWATFRHGAGLRADRHCGRPVRPSHDASLVICVSI